jgi:hypothetical protein
MGRLIPAGTGFEWYRNVRSPAEEDLDLDREIEYAFDVEEPMAGRAPTGDVE